MAIGKLDVQLALDTAEFTAGVNKAEASLSKFSQAMATMAGTMAGNLLGGAIAKGIDAVANSFRDAVKAVEDFQNAAIGMGAAGQAQGLQSLATGINALGVSTKNAQEQVTTFSSALKDKMMGEATNATRALDKLGVSVTTASGQLKPQAQIMQEAINKLATYRDDAFKAAAAQELFGNNAAANAQLMTQTGSAVTEAAAAAAASTAAWTALSGELARAQQATQPLINALSQGLAEAAQFTVQSAMAMGEALSGPLLKAFDLLAETAGFTGKDVGDAMVTAGQILAGAAAGIISVIASLIAAFGELAKAAYAAGQAIAAALGGDMAGAAAAGGRALEALGKTGDIALNTVTVATNQAIAAGEAYGKSIVALKDKAAAAAKALEGTAKPRPSIGSVGAPKGGGGGGGKGGGKSDAEKELEALERYAEAVKNAADPQRVFTAEIDKFNKAMAAGLLTMDQYAVAVSMATKKMEAAAKSSGLPTPMLDFKKGLKSWGDEVAGSLADAIVEGDNLNDVFKSLIKSLAKMALELLVLKPLMQSLTSGMSGMFGGVGGLAAPMAAASGGASALGRAVPTTNALASGIIYPRQGVSGRASSGGPSKITNNLGNISMNISPDGGGVSGETKQGQQFGERVRALIQREMVTQSQPGGLLRARG